MFRLLDDVKYLLGFGNNPNDFEYYDCPAPLRKKPIKPPALPPSITRLEVCDQCGHIKRT